MPMKINRVFLIFLLIKIICFSLRSDSSRNNDLLSDNALITENLCDGRGLNRISNALVVSNCPMANFPGCPTGYLF